MGFLDRLKNMTPFDEMANAGMAAARGIGNVAGQGAYGLGRAAGTGVGAFGRVAGQGANLYGKALGQMAGMGMDAAQGIGNYGLQGAQALGNYGMQGAGAATRGLGAAGRFIGSSAMDNFQRQADLAESLGRGVGGAAMGAGRGFMDGVTDSPGRMGGGRSLPIVPRGRIGLPFMQNQDGNRQSGLIEALRKLQLQNQQGPMMQVRAPGGVPLR